MVKVWNRFCREWVDPGEPTGSGLTDCEYRQFLSSAAPHLHVQGHRGAQVTIFFHGELVLQAQQHHLWTPASQREQMHLWGQGLAKPGELWKEEG